MMGWPVIWTETNNPAGIAVDVLEKLYEVGAGLQFNGRVYRVVRVATLTHPVHGPGAPCWEAELFPVRMGRGVRT